MKGVLIPLISSKMAANKVKAKDYPVPPWSSFHSTVVEQKLLVAEQNFLHGGTDWFLHAFCLILIEETLEDALWRER